MGGGINSSSIASNKTVKLAHLNASSATSSSSTRVFLRSLFVMREEKYSAGPS